MRVLYISKAFEGNIGAEIHYNIIKDLFLEENVFTVDLRPKEAFREHNYIAYGKYNSPMERIKRWLQGNTMFINNSTIKELLDIISEEDIEVVYIEDSVFGNLVRKIKKRFPKIKIISFYHDIKADLYSQWKKKANTVNKIEYSIGIKQEKINNDYCDINIVFNKRDAEEYKKYYKRPPEAVLPLSCSSPKLEEDYFNQVTMKKQKKTFLFVGKKYYPNIVGIQWLVDNVVDKLDSNIKIQIVGRGLEYLKEEIDKSLVDIIGGVDDLSEYYKNADVVIAPLFDGGGMKSKTLEAFSYGKMFLGTEESLFGFWEETPDSLKDTVVYKKETPEEWVETMNKIAGLDIKKAYKEEYDLFVEKFSYDILKNSMKTIFIGE